MADVFCSEFEWRKDRTKATIFSIEPLLNEPPLPISRVFKRQGETHPNSECEGKERKEFYEAQIDTFKANMIYFTQTQTSDLNLNQIFVLNGIEYKDKEFLFKLVDSDEEVKVNRWILLASNVGTEEISTQPQTSYYLSTIVNNHFYYLLPGNDYTLSNISQ